MTPSSQWLDSPDLALLVLLFAGHVLGDFLLQTRAMVERKAEPPVLLQHAVLVVLAHGLLLLPYLPGEPASFVGALILLVLLGALHALVDWGKLCWRRRRGALMASWTSRRCPMLVVLATGLACAPVGPAGGGASAPLQVAVTVPPQAYLVERIGGERVATAVLMSSGSSEETFSPSPRQLVALSRADLYVLVGHPAFVVEERHVLPALARNPRVHILSMWAAPREPMERPVPISDRAQAGPHRHDHAHGDPHLWTAPRHMRSAAVAVSAALAELDPAGASLYRARLGSFLAELDALDAEIRRELAGAPRRRFLVTHPAWGHLAAQYGLEQVAIEEEGKEPGPRALVALVEAARADGVPVVFSQEGFPDAAARAVAAEIGARVVPLDPLARSWLDNTRATARAIAAALGTTGPAAG